MIHFSELSSFGHFVPMPPQNSERTIVSWTLQPEQSEKPRSIAEPKFQKTQKKTVDPWALK